MTDADNLRKLFWEAFHMSFWRRFSKILFSISLIVSGLGVIIAAIAGFTQHFLIGLGILIGGALLVIVVHSLIGTFLEMCDNVADIRAMTVNGTLRVQNEAAPQNVRNTYNKLSAIADSNNDKTWVCRACGTTNDNSSATCKGCGKYK